MAHHAGDGRVKKQSSGSNDGSIPTAALQRMKKNGRQREKEKKEKKTKKKKERKKLGEWQALHSDFSLLHTKKTMLRRRKKKKSNGNN